VAVLSLLSETFVVLHLNCNTGTGQQLVQLQFKQKLMVMTVMMMMMMVMMRCSHGRHSLPARNCAYLTIQYNCAKHLLQFTYTQQPLLLASLKPTRLLFLNIK